MNLETLLLRQAHSNFVVDGQLTSQAFCPFPKDDGELSVYDGDQITAERSFEHYTDTQGLDSAGVWAVSKGEVDSAGVSAHPSPLDNFPEHASINFNECAENKWRKIAKLLKRKALNRGCQFALEE